MFLASLKDLHKNFKRGRGRRENLKEGEKGRESRKNREDGEEKKKKRQREGKEMGKSRTIEFLFVLFIHSFIVFRIYIYIYICSYQIKKGIRGGSKR